MTTERDEWNERQAELEAQARQVMDEWRRRERRALLRTVAMALVIVLCSMAIVLLIV